MTSAEKQAFYIGSALAKLAEESSLHEGHSHATSGNSYERAVEAIDDEVSRSFAVRNLSPGSLASGLAGRMGLDPSGIARYKFVIPSGGQAAANPLADAIVTEDKVAPSVLAHELGHLKSQRGLGGRAIQAVRSLGDPEFIAPGVGAGALAALGGAKGGKAGALLGLLALGAAAPTYLQRVEEERAWDEADMALDSLQRDSLLYGEDEREAARETKKRALETYDSFGKSDAIGLASAPAAFLAARKMKGRLGIPIQLAGALLSAKGLMGASNHLLKPDSVRDSERARMDNTLFLSRTSL